MNPGLAGRVPDGPVFRIGRRPDPWEWPDWSLAGPGGTFGNRWDDPMGQYRVLYACSERIGAFLETLARFRGDAELRRALDRIDGPVDAMEPGVVPAVWRRGRVVARAVISGRFADIGHHQSLGHIQSEMIDELRPMLARAGLAELDAAAIKLSVPRTLTQQISRRIYEQSTPEGRAEFAGIAYSSRLGDDLTNWAIFEPAPPIAEAPFTVLDRTEIDVDDPDFLRAVELLGLRIEGA